MRPPALVAVALVAAVLAGCADGSAKDADLPPQAILPAPGGDLPSTAKLEFPSSRPPLVDVLPAQPDALVKVPAATGHVHLAFDLQAGEGAGPLALRIVAPNGAEVARHDLTEGGKLVVALALAPGDHRLYATSAAAWTVGLVATAFPASFDEGLRLQVSTPQQTGVEHRFYPDTLRLAPGQPWRITLYDYDPHGGIENLQHNLHFPSLGLRTEGKTTWGEVRVLDLPALAAGSYPFECEFHGFTGTLVVG